MSTGKLVFSQVMDHLPWHNFQQLVNQYSGNHFTGTPDVPGLADLIRQRTTARHRGP